MLDKNKNATAKDNTNLQDVKVANLNNSIGKLFEQFGSSGEFKINMDDRLCMHCWIVKSTLYCSTCMCFYCASCAHMNHVSAGSYHDIISVHHLSVSRTDTAKSLQEKRKNLCKRHKNKELTYCCTSCNYMLICETCIIIDGHGSHLLLTLAEAIPRGRQILLQSLSSLNAASFYMSQKISEISALAEQRKSVFENNLINVEETQKSLNRAIASEEQLLFTEIDLLANKLNRGGEDICKSCENLKEMLITVCGEVSIILQLSKESPSHSLNRYVKISNVVKGTLDPSYRVLVPELQHLSVPYWNLFPEIIDDVLNDTNKYTQEHIDHAMKLSDAITKIASGDISVVEDIGQINAQVYAKSNSENERAARAKVHKIFTSKLKMIQHERLKNIQNPLIAPKSSLKLDPKNKAKSKAKAAQTGPKLQEWLGLRDWKNNQSRKQNNAKNKNPNGFKIPNEAYNSTSKGNKSIFDDLGIIRALSDGDIKFDEIVEKDIEIMTIGRDKKLEALGRTKEEKLQTEEFYESQVHFSGTLMGACIFTKKDDGIEVFKMDDELTKINFKYCFPFIVIYDASSSEKQNSKIMDKAYSIKGGMNEHALPTISPGLERIDIPIVLGKIEKPKNSLFVADIRQSNIRIQSIHSNSITPETSKFLGATANSLKPIEDGFEISNVIKGNTIDSWVFSCPDFNTAEKWISMLKGEDLDVKSCIKKVGTARLCIKSLANKRNNQKMSESKLTENPLGSTEEQAFIDVVPKIPNNAREKLLISVQPDHHELTQTIIYEDDEGEYYEEQEIELPDVMSIRLDRKLSAKKTKSLEKLMIPSILKIGKDSVIQIEKLNVIGSSFDSMNLQVVALTKNRLYITSPEIFEKNLSHDLLLDEYSIQEKCFIEPINLTDSSDPSNSSRFYVISPKLKESPKKNDNSMNKNYFGFEYGENRHPINDKNNNQNDNSNNTDRTTIKFICPSKDSEQIWLDSIYNHTKKKPLKYWRQILDGIIVRHRRRFTSPKSSKGPKSLKNSGALSHSKRRSSRNNIFEESDKFTDTSTHIQQSDMEAKNLNHHDYHHNDKHGSNEDKKTNETSNHSKDRELFNTSNSEGKSTHENSSHKSSFENVNNLKNNQNFVRFNLNNHDDIGKINRTLSSKTFQTSQDFNKIFRDKPFSGNSP
ncbi:B-box zinc finger domain-containing protein [Cryptosporidium ubiquitum]|uniref:B-box zinc finger domain-containing protein n=1 Tax=Cryptosporidium ubiquitum TaxID=857276 RepID=A0A1J4MKL0_9CRYT|nr:B-box zinc finger domain-containing protein [Cryptosporidium ubiquitum]OII73397.1 B-box zinc finger domain-containing protein [Cryptosporidium ubiquitum]